MPDTKRKAEDTAKQKRKGAMKKPYFSAPAGAVMENDPACAVTEAAPAEEALAAEGVCAAAGTSAAAEASPEEKELRALLESGTTYRKTGFSVDLSREPARWDALIRHMGQPAVYDAMAHRLCEGYRERYGREFLFDDPCVSYELAYHVTAYLWALGYEGYTRHLSTLLFTREQLIKHCESVDISVRDLNDLKQRLMFGYDQGIRPSCREAYENGEWDI